MGGVLDAVEATVGARSAAVIARSRRGGPDGPAIGHVFAGAMDLARCCGGGVDSPLDWLGRRAEGSYDVWWEPSGPTTLIAGEWMSFAEATHKVRPAMAIDPHHPLFLLRAIPEWLGSAESGLNAAGEARLVLDLGASMSRSGAIIEALRFIDARIRVDDEGRCVELSHTFSENPGGAFNPWRTTELFDFGAPVPACCVPASSAPAG
jgi:hypothetical protein